MRTRLFRERADTLTRLFELFNLTKLGEREYEGLIGSYRTGIPYKIFRRNVVAALGHSNRSDAIPLLESALEATDPEVRKVARVSMKMLQDSGEAREV
jgi:epoxyqueuosine reductase QueG